MISKIDTSWDVDKYKTPYELEHEWNLKKKFILAHKVKYPESRLVSLAQMFCNIHFLGCKYDESVMRLLESLSKEITDKNEKWERPSFVSASAAVEERVEARFNKGDQHSFANKGRIAFIQSSNLGASDNANNLQSYIKEEAKRKGEVWIRGQKRPASNEGPGPSKISRLNMNESNIGQTRHSNYSMEYKRNQFNIRRVVDSGPFGKVVVFQSAISKEESPISVVERTASAAHMTTSFDFTPQFDGVSCKLSLDGLYLATGQGRSQKIAKEAACKVAIERLKETSFTIIVKASFAGSESVDRDLNTNRTNDSANVDTPIADSNIGSKLLKLMGWSGGGLGKNQQGIEEPIKPYENTVRRGGLGISNISDFRRKIIRIIEDFAHRDTKEDLIFSPDFTKEERKVIHDLVRKYNLKSRSFGKEENSRRLVVFKKIRPLEIVEDLMNLGGETAKYKLIAPLSVDCT